MKTFKTVNDYFDSLPEESAEILGKMRAAIKQTAPKAIEKISYNMPAFDLNGNLCYYAAFKNHVSLFPYPSAIVKFKSELKDYTTSKGTIQFPNTKALPVTLIKKIIRFRIAERLMSEAAKKKKPVAKRKSKVSR